MACINPNDPRFQEILKRVNNPLLAEIEYDKEISEGVQSVKSTQISKKIKDDLPVEIADAVTVVDEVPEDILGRDDLFLSMKAIFEENNITDPLLINWAGVNKAIIGHPKTIKSEQQLLDIVQRRYNEKQKESNHPELKRNPLALKSFNEWKDALKSYPIVFQDIMLGHAIKYLRNPNRRSKYVLQLSKVALTNTYGMLVNKPHEANRLGKLYDMEVISSLTDALDYEPSASGAGYWVHIPRTENDGINLGFSSYQSFEKSKKEDIERVKKQIAEEEKKKDPALYEKLKKEKEELLNKKTTLTTQEPNLNRADADKYGFQGYDYVRVESTYSRWERGDKPHVQVLGEDYEGYYIHGYNTQADKPSTRILPITREQAEEIWKKEVENYPMSALEIDDRQEFLRLETELLDIKPEDIENRINRYNIQLQNLEQLLKDVTADNWEQVNASKFKRNVDLLRKLSPSTWCTASSMTEHYVANYDNYLLIVNGVTVAGIEVYPLKKVIEPSVKEVDILNDGTISYIATNKNGTVRTFETKDEAENFIEDDEIKQIKQINQDIETYRTGVISKDTKSKNWIITYSDPKWFINYTFTEEAAERLKEKKIKELEEKLKELEEKLNAYKKRQVKEVTSRANNGTASINHLDDTIAFFEKHNLDLNNRTIKNAIRAREQGKNDSELEREEQIVPQGMEWIGPEDWEGPDEGRYYEPFEEFDPRYEQEYYEVEMERAQQIDTVAAMNTIEEVRENLELVVRYFNYLKEEFRSNQEIATAAILRDSHYIANIPNTVPFYMDLAAIAVRAQPSVFEYLSDEAKLIPGLREMYDEYNRDVDLLPFSKTKNNLIQGYYDPKNDKVVVVASNTPVDEASKIAIHEVAHRGMLRMAKDLGGVEQLNQALLNAEKELMRKVPELLKRTGHVTVDELVRDYGFERDSKEGRMKLLMELAARWAETLVDKPKPSWWKQFLKDIGQWIKQFTGAILNEKEVNELVGGFVRYGTEKVKEEKSVTTIKPEVQALFESNPDLANQVYEALGLNVKLDENTKEYKFNEYKTFGNKYRLLQNKDWVEKKRKDFKLSDGKKTKYTIKQLKELLKQPFNTGILPLNNDNIFITDFSKTIDIVTSLNDVYDNFKALDKLKILKFADSVVRSKDVDTNKGLLNPEFVDWVKLTGEVESSKNELSKLVYQYYDSFINNSDFENLVYDNEKINKTVEKINKELNENFDTVVDAFSEEENERRYSEEFKNYLNEESDKESKIIYKELTPEQKQQALQLYSQYLDTGKQDIEGFKKFVSDKNKEQTPTQFNRTVNVPTEQQQNTKISQNIINALAETLGLNLGVKLTQITSEQARQMDPNWTNEPAFYLNGVVYIVDGAMTLENVLHEFSHPLFDAIYMSNKKLFDKLYSETTRTTEGAAIVAAVKEAYPEYDENGDMFKKEVMVRALTTVAEAQVLKQETSKSFKDVIKKILFAFKQMLRNLFGNSIKIEKLNVNTSLKDLAKMLTGDKFNINTEMVSPKDVAQYSRNVDEFVNSFNKLEDDKLIEMIDNLNKETLRSIGKVKNSKNIEEVKAKLINDEQQGILDRILDTLATGTTLNESIAKIENEEKKRSLNSHNFVHSILQIEQFITYLQENFNDIISNQQGQELVSSLNAYQKLLSNWSDFVKYTSDTLIDNGMARNSPLGAKLSIMSKSIEDLNEDIVRGYGPGVVNVLKEALMPLINTLQEHYATHLAEVEKKYAENPSPKLLKYIENLKKERDNFTLDDKKIKDLMIGRYGDTNIFSAYMEAYTNSPDPIVGGLAMFIKNAYTDVENRFQSDMQDYKKDIYSLLEKAGYSRNQFTKVNEKLLFKNKTYFYNTITGELEEREEWTFLNPLQDETFYMAQFKQQYEEAKAAGDKQKMEEIRIEQKKHRRKYFHQKYKDEFYEREDIYDDFNTYFDAQTKKYEETLISQGIGRGTREFRNKMDTWRKREDVRLVAYDILGIDPANATAAQIEEVNRMYMEAASEALKRKNELLVDIGVKQNETWDEENFEEIAEELEQDWRQYGRLASQTDMLGNPKVGKERLMSAIERKFRKDTNEFYEWSPKENAFEMALDKFEQTLLDAGILKNSDEFNQKRDIWIKKNTVISYTPEWYAERNEKIVRLKELMAKLPEETRKKIDTTEELELLLGLSVGFRDKDGQIIGDEMSDASKQKVKDLQEAILEKRSQMAGLSGLSKEEMTILTQLFIKIKNRTGLTTQEQITLDDLLEKQDRLGISKATKAEMSRIFAELSDLQQKEPTSYYLDAINNWMEFLGEPPIDEMNVDDLYEMGKLDTLFNKSPEFQEWFEKNHILKESYKSGPAAPGDKKGPAVYELKYERMFIWSRTRPTDPAHYESFELTTGEIIPGKPSLAYYNRHVKDEVSDLEILRNRQDLSQKERERLNVLLQKEAAGTLVSFINKKVVGKTVNNLGNSDGNFLPKSREDGAPADSPYINERYYELKAKEPKLFELLEKMKEYHLEWQKDALPESRLYMAIPKFRTKSSEAIFRVSKGVKRWKQWFYNIRSWFKSAPDDQELGLSYDPDVLARLEMVDEDIRKIPVHGIYDLEVDEVSLDISGGLMRYRMGTLKQAKLLELSPVADAISQYIEQEEFIVKGADKALKGQKKKKKLGRYDKKQAIAKIWDNLKRTGQYRKLKRKKSTRLNAINNLLEREIEGITQSEWVSKAPGVLKVKNFVTKAASTAFFGLNPLGAFKNKIAAQVQSFIEAGGGKYISMRSLARGKWTSLVMLSKHTMEIYSSKSNSIEVQMMQIFNPGQELLQEYEKDSFTRTALTDAVNFSFLTNPRKWLQYKATLDVFNGMMFHQTVDLYYRGNSQKIYYAEAFEMVDGKIRLKEGIDPEWANYPVDHTVERGETADSIASKYGITVEELYKRNKLEADAEILPGDVLELGRSRQFKGFKNRMHEITNRLEGAFAKMDRTEADRNFFFQLIIFMKRFFGHMAGNYFAGRRTSAALGDISIGNWPGFVKTIGNLFMYGTGYLQYQRSEERAAAKRMITAVLTIAAFYMLRSFLWDWDWLDSSEEAHEKIKARSGDYFADDYNRQGFIANWELALMMGVLTETETWTNPIVAINTVKGIPDPGTVSDQALIKPTTIIAEYLAYLNKDEGSVYKQDAGPYSWQKKDQPKWKASFMKMLGFTGANFDPNKAIENLERYNRTFSGTK